MDPEIIAQLEEQLRELTDTISRQTSMMGEQMAAMNKMAGSAAANTKANASATQTTTKYQEAQQKAYEQQERSIQSLKKFEAAIGILSSAVGAAAGVLGSMANSLLSSQKGLTKYGEVANQAAAGAENLAKSIPIVGDALGALVGTFGKIAAKVITDGLALVDSLTTLRDGLVKTGGSLPVTAGQLADLAKDARYSGENMKVLGKITESLGTGLRSLDATAGRGAVKFMEMANVTDETRRQFGRMGVDQERLTELQALYVKQQQASGNSYDLQTKTAAQLRKESLAYAENMQKLSALTGKQAEQLQSEQEAVAAVVQERMATLKQMADEKRLRDAGDTVAADAIKAEREKRQKFAQELQKMGLTQDEQMKAMQMYRLGAYTDYTKSMAQLNPGLMSLAQGVKNGSISVEKGAEDFGKGLTEGKIRLSNNLDGIADAIDPSVLGDTFGLTSETLKAPLDQLGQSLGESKKAADADTEAAKNRKDEVGDAVENIKSAERELQAKYQDFLMTQIESISKLINQVDIFTEIQEHAATVAKVMAAGMGLVVAANVALAAAAWKAARNLSKIAGGMDRLGRDGGPLGDAEDKAKGKGGKGKWGRRLAKGLKGGIAGILGGLALDWASEKATESGHKKTGAALDVGSSALGWAGTGAMIGSVIPGLGTAVGGAVGGVLGGLYGLYNNWDTLTESAKEEQAKAKEDKAATDPRAAEIAALRKRVEESKAAIAAPSAATAIPGAQAVDQTAKDQAKAEEERTKTEKERAKATTESQKYTIKQGDTLSQLAKTFGTTVEALLKANPDIKNKDLIYAGNQLNVPGEQYTVKQGDTLKGIAAALGINLDDLLKANPNIKNKDWKAGYKLNIAGLGGGQEQDPGTYSVKQGDTLAGIAAALGISTDELLKANPNIKNKDWKEGFKLNIAGLGGMAVPGVPMTPGQTSQLGMNEKVLEDQLEQNRKLFREPMQQAEEEKKTQQQTFTDLVSSMAAFKKNVDGSSKALLDLMAASDELYKAFTGRDRPGSDAAKAADAAAPPGSPGPGFTGGANTEATLDNVMAMQYQKESAGGTALRAKGLSNAQSMGGAYGMGKAAREAAFASMSKEERAAFAAATGFNRAPTLDELVNKEGTAFLSEKARIADEMLAKKHNENAITMLTKKLGRPPTMKDMRGSNWLGPAGYPAFLEALAKNPNMTMAQFYAQHPEWTTPDMKQFGGPNTTLAQFEQTLIEHSGGRGQPAGLAGAAPGNPTGDLSGKFPNAQSAGGIVPLGKALQALGLRVDENIYFDGKHPAPGAHSQKGGHYDGTAIDVNAPGSVVEANDPKWGPMFDQIARAGAAAGYHTLWKSPDGNHHNHIHFQYSGSMGANSKIGAARGGIFRGPKDGYPMELHGTEMILPLDTPSMRGNKIADLMSSLTKTGVKESGIGKISKINDALMQIVNMETTKAIKAVSEANSPLQNISTEISNSMRKVMEAHNDTMTELTYKLGDMIDALHTSNDVTKKILKKASA